MVGYFTTDVPTCTRSCTARSLPWGVGSRRANDEAISARTLRLPARRGSNLIANQETARYLPDYHAESDTLDKVDLKQARHNAAIAAVAVSGIANAPARVGRRQSRSEVERVLVKSGLAEQMKIYGLWSDWESGKRGRK